MTQHWGLPSGVMAGIPFLLAVLVPHNQELARAGHGDPPATVTMWNIGSDPTIGGIDPEQITGDPSGMMHGSPRERLNHPC